MQKSDHLPIAFSGVVKKGRHLGRKLGYPTANLSFEHGKLPSIPHGVYAGWTAYNNKRYLSIMSFGQAKTIGEKDIVFEIHLLDYQGDLYGQKLEVEVSLFVRDMIKFDSLDELKNAMAEDEKQAREQLVANQ